MSDINVTVLSGTIDNLEAKGTGKGTLPLTTFTLKNGDDKRTSFIRCVAWGETSDALGSAENGDRILIQGRIQTRSYEGKDGNTRQSTEVVVNRFDLLITNTGEETDDEDGLPF